ncbi:hypothetical protein H2203_002479 [Taxawa tesnikishii (nom. ined.)]|nr:hypothetical protein H2203_002479 [Dothideales sp. JES 119]
MADIIRDAPVGQLIRYVTRNRYLKYPEEREGWKCPRCYAEPDSKASLPSEGNHVPADKEPHTEPEFPLDSPAESPYTEKTENTIDVEKADAAKAGFERAESLHSLTLARTATDTSHPDIAATASARSHLSTAGYSIALEKSHTRAELEHAYAVAVAMENAPSHPIAPAKLDDGTILVDWYTTDDPENPQAWSFGKKAFVTFLVCIYTTAVYTGSAIVSASAEGIMERFHVGPTAASLTLSLYVLAYGIGPLVFSPLSEIPLIGRNPPYMITFAIFVILSVPTALVDNFAGLLVLRFLQGFFGSPCLATGGASLGDMYSLIKLPYVLTLWAFAACVGPAMGPVISGFSVSAENWRWSLWEILWLAGPVWLAMFFFMPETNPANILLRRAQRLRKLTGDSRLKAQSEIDQSNLSFKDVAVESLVRPVQLMLFDPAIAYTDIYIALCYGIFYSFFEAFPIVYIGHYGFNLGEMGLAFLSITAGVLVSVAVYYAYLYWILEPSIRAHGLGAPERRLVPALFSTFLIPVGLFIFAWTSKASIHWIVSCIGVALFTVGLFVMFQCVFVYLPLTYPAYAASLFAGNDFLRSCVAAGSILYARPLFVNLRVGPGVSLLAALTAFMILGIFVLFFFGERLRAKSRFAAK